MRKSAEELAMMVKKIVGEDNNSDEVIELLESITDSVNPDTEYTKERFDELDRTWRDRYIARFMGEVKSEEDETPMEDDREENVDESITINDLFKED